MSVVLGPCDWIFQHPEFGDWMGPDQSKAAKKPPHGYSGVGKIVVTAKMNEKPGLERSVAYFCIFTYRLKRQPQQLLRS